MHASQQDGIDFLDQSFADGAFLCYHIKQQVDGFSVVAGIEKILEWFTLYRQPFLQKENGFAWRQGAAFDGVAVIRPFGAELLLDGLPVCWLTGLGFGTGRTGFAYVALLKWDT